MQQQNKTTRTRNQPLAPHHQQTARLLFLALDVKRGAMKLDVPADDLRVVRWNLTRLINLSDTRREGDNHAQAFVRALQALRVNIDAGWIDHNKVYRHAEAIEDRLECYAPKPQREQKAKPAETFTTLVDTNRFTFFGLLSGDVVTSEETRDIRPGELITWREKEPGAHIDEDNRYLVRFVSLTDTTLTYLRTDGDTETEEVSNIESLARVTGYTRIVTFPRLDPATDAAPQDSPAQVVDLSCYRQAHPQRIRNLLFAEKQ